MRPVSAPQDPGGAGRAGSRTAADLIRRLVERVQTLGLAEGRRLALGVLRQVKMDQRLKDLVLRQLTAQRSAAGLADSLVALAAFLEVWPSVPSPPLRRLPTRASDLSAELRVVPVDEILYFFGGRIFADDAPGRGLMRVPRATIIRGNRVYARTAGPAGPARDDGRSAWRCRGVRSFRAATRCQLRQSLYWPAASQAFPRPISSMSPQTRMER